MRCVDENLPKLGRGANKHVTIAYERRYYGQRADQDEHEELVFAHLADLAINIIITHNFHRRCAFLLFLLECIHIFSSKAF